MVRLTLSTDIQKSLGCAIGEQITAENPWINIKKAVLVAHVTEKITLSEFYQFKDIIMVSYTFLTFVLIV